MIRRLKQFDAYVRQRYGAMWTLLFVSLLALGMILNEIFQLAASFEEPHADSYLSWMYVCNLACYLFVSVQLLRLDCRRLLSRRTAGILNACGSSIILLMVVRNHLARHVSSVDLDTTVFYSEDVFFIYLLGFVLIFCARIVQRAASVKEEQDLTI